jgi:divalent metal cation (Fe/Co/Zn/Cd) transporter
MKRLIKGLTFLLPTIAVSAGITYVAMSDIFLQSIFIKIFYGISTLIALLVSVLVLFVLWQMTKTGIYILLGTTIQKKKSESATE